jgi:DnaJ domain
MVVSEFPKDPYKILQTPHSATDKEIKSAYRAMAKKYHPDKFVMPHHDDTERQQATLKFSECAAAYAILSDKQRKDEYDHIYKYGGYDSGDTDHHQNSTNNQHLRRSNKNRTMSIGYTCYDPCAFLWSQGQLESRRTMAGIQLPSTTQSTRATSPFGMVTFSTGRTKTCTNTGTTQFVGETKQYYPFEKRIRTIAEIVTFHADGRQDVVIEEGDGNSNNNFNDEAKRRHQYTTFSTINHQQRIHTTGSPWCMQAWKNMHDNFFMCFNPCAAVRDE